MSNRPLTDNERRLLAATVIAIIAEEIVARQSEGAMLDIDADALESLLLALFSDHLARTAVSASAPAAHKHAQQHFH